LPRGTNDGSSRDAERPRSSRPSAGVHLDRPRRVRRRCLPLHLVSPGVPDLLRRTQQCDHDVHDGGADHDDAAERHDDEAGSVDDGSEYLEHVEYDDLEHLRRIHHHDDERWLHHDDLERLVVDYGVIGLVRPRRHLLRLWLTARDLSHVEDLLRGGMAEPARPVHVPNDMAYAAEVSESASGADEGVRDRSGCFLQCGGEVDVLRDLQVLRESFDRRPIVDKGRLDLDVMEPRSL